MSTCSHHEAPNTNILHVRRFSEIDVVMNHHLLRDRTISVE